MDKIKSIGWQAWAMLIMAVVILVLLFLPRSCGKREEVLIGDLTVSQEKELKANLLILESENDSLRNELAKVARKDSIQRSAHIAAVTPHKKVIKRLEKDPEVIKVRDSLPKVDSLLKAKDSVIVHHEKRLAEQDLTAQVTKEINEQVVKNFETRLADTETLLHEKELENQKLTKENRKLRRGRVLRNVLIPVALVGGLLLGVQVD